MSASTKNASRPSSQGDASLVLPCDAYAEQCILNLLLGHGREVAEQVGSMLTKRDFYHGRYRVLFEAVMLVIAEGNEIMPQTVAEVLSRLPGRLEGVGGLPELEHLASRPPRADGAIPMAKSLIRYRVRRDMILTAQKVAAMAADTLHDHEAMLAQSVAMVQQSAAGNPQDSRTEKASQIGQRVMADIRDRSTRGDALLGISSGLSSWDRVVSGIVPKRLNLIAGRPGMGKTASLLTMSHHTARCGSPSIVFSMEMDNDFLWHRALSMSTGIDSRRIAVGSLSPQEWTAVESANQHWCSLPLAMNDVSRMTIREIETVTRQFVAETKGKLTPTLYVDYAQLIQPDKGARPDSYARVLEEIAYGLKDLVKTLGIGCVLLAQLNREVEKREDKRPRMSDLADSSGLEKSADTVTLLYRPGYYASLQAVEEGATKEGSYEPSPAEEAEWIVAKVRGGQPTALKMTYNPSRVSFSCGSPNMEGF